MWSNCKFIYSLTIPVIYGTYLVSSLFERLQQGSSLLGKHILESLDAKAIRKWLAMQIYKYGNPHVLVIVPSTKTLFRSEFSASPQKRSDDKCFVHLYDEASVPITSVSVDYVMGKMVAGGFISVPIVIQDSGDDVSTGVIAASYLNTSIHQSKASHVIIKL